jgi:hypothetical protein
MTAQLTAGQLDEWAADLPMRFLECRDMGHSWRYAGARRTELNSWERTMRCTRCRTERHQTISTHGTILAGGYSYPDGYLAPPSTGRLTADDRAGLRLQSLTRHEGH